MNSEAVDKCNRDDDAGGKGKQRQHEDICVICLEPISERAFAVPCNHCLFDFICLVSWLQNNPQCPLSFKGKTSTSAVEYDWRAPDDCKIFIVESLLPAPGDNGHPGSSQQGPPRQARTRGRRWLPRAQRQSATTSNPHAAVSRRRFIYRHSLYSLHVGSSVHSRYRDFTPTSFTKDSVQQSRARMWIRRELQVFDFLFPGFIPDSESGSSSMTRTWSGKRVENAEFLLSYIISILSTVDIKSSTGAAQRLVGEFLGEDNATLFLHELSHWLRSPYTQLEAWDRHVQYSQKIPDYSHRDEQDRTT